MPYAPSRRIVIAGIAGLILAPAARAAGPDLPGVVVTRDPSCGCCGAWAEHMRAAGFPVEIVETRELNRVKARLGVPRDLASCHTAEVGGYVLEGHVPAAEVKRLLAERPAARGLAVPGMPANSPGMEMPGPDEAYEVVLFGPQRRVFARYQGPRAL
jgi:hypothetical protein